MRLFLSLVTATLLLCACSPEVGSDKWCEKMKEVPRGEWTIDESKAYAKHCLF